MHPREAKMDSSVPVVVLKTVRGAFQHGDVCLARSLGRLGVPVYVFQNSDWAPTARSRYVRGTLTWNFATQTQEGSVAHLLEVGCRLGGRPILIPTDDVGAMLVGDHADKLREVFRFPEQRPGLARALASKKELFLLCKRVGVPAPETEFPSSRGEVLEFVERTRFPVVVKSIEAGYIPWTRGGQSVFIAEDVGELVGYYAEVEDPQHPNLMLQEYIPGGPDSIWMFDGYFNAESECLLGFTGQKIRQYPRYTGPTSLGECVPNALVDTAAREFLKRVGYRGIVDLDFGFDRRDGSYRLLDVNPRIGATFRLFVAANGLDVARALYLDLTGAPQSAREGRPGRRWVTENSDVLASAAYLREGALSVGEWIRSYRGVEEGAWFAWDDPVPFGLMCAGFPLKLARTAVKERLRKLAAVRC